jgi:hypothetical protein
MDWTGPEAEEVYFFGAPGHAPAERHVVAPVPGPARPPLSASAGVPAKPSLRGWREAVLGAEAAPVVPHVPAAAPPVDRSHMPLCTFFLQGRCRFGDSCRFRHAQKPDEDEVMGAITALAVADAERRAAAAAAAAAAEEAGEGTDAGTAPAAAASASASASASNPASHASVDAASAEASAREAPGDAGATAGVSETALAVAEKLLSWEAECGVCFEHPAPLGRPFGLLEGCDHTFCLDCIRAWRATPHAAKEQGRSCPLCRQESFFVVPSDRLVTDPVRKEALVAAYRGRLGAIRCRHFDAGRGTCPFGTSCWYLHQRADGTIEDKSMPSLRFASDGTGTIGVLPQVRLSDFFA